MALYGYIAPNKRPNDPYGDYFSETRKMIDAKTAIDQASKAAEDTALESIGELPELGPNSMFMSYGDAYKQMATYLRDNKDELLATEEGRKQYQQLLDGATQWSAYGKDHTAKVNPMLKTNMTIAKSGVNPSKWESAGMQDKYSYEDYVAKTAELDSARFSVNVKDGQWVVSDEAGEHSINDDSLFDLSFFDDHLVTTSEKPPSEWWSLNHQDSRYKDEAEAVTWVTATVSDNSRYTLDALRWAEKNGVFEDGITAEEAKNSPGRVEDAVKAYARDAVPEGWTKESASQRRAGRNSSNDEEVFTVSDDDILRSSSDEAGSYPNEDGSDLVKDTDIAAMDMPQVLTINAAQWTEPSVEEGSTQAFRVAGLESRQGSGDIFITTATGEKVAVMEGSNEYKSLKRQIDEKFGDGAFDKMIGKLRAAANEHVGETVDTAQWRLDNLEVQEPQAEANTNSFARGGRIFSRLFGR